MNNKQRSKAIIDMLLEENAELKRQLKRVKNGYASVVADKLKDTPMLEEDSASNKIIFDDALVETKCIEILSAMQDHAMKAREYYLKKIYPDTEEEAEFKKHSRYMEAGVSEILRLTGNLSKVVEETTTAYMKVLKELVVTSKEALIDFYHPVQNARLVAAESIKTFFRQKRKAIERKLNEIKN